MPAAAKKVVSTPVIVPNPFAERGMAVALAELAAARVMDVADVVTFPKMLAEAGLPEKPGHRLVELAHRLNRNSIEAMLWRCNRPLTEEPPMLSAKDAARYAEIGTQQQAAAAAPATKIVRPTAPAVAAQTPKPQPVAFGVAGLFTGE
jgi:hypothetical protein